MSTLMSRDINLTRSSTRVHQTPGGTSSISFGDGYVETPVRRAVQQPYQQQERHQAPVVRDSFQNREEQYRLQAPPPRAQNNIFNNENENEIPAQRANRRPSGQVDHSQMKSVMQDNYSNSQQNRRVRQAPGGSSSIVIG